MTYRTDTVVPKIVEMIQSLAPSLKETVVLGEETKILDLSPEFDSLDHVELVMNVEDNWNIRFTDAEISKLSTIGDLASAICVKVC